LSRPSVCPFSVIFTIQDLPFMPNCIFPFCHSNELLKFGQTLILCFYVVNLLESAPLRFGVRCSGFEKSNISHRYISNLKLNLYFTYLCTYVPT
jgi:hypothetical protein